jgi:hypothetical protein
MTGEILRRRLEQGPAGQWHEVRMMDAELGTGVPAGGQRTDLDSGVATQEPE